MKMVRITSQAGIAGDRDTREFALLLEPHLPAAYRLAFALLRSPWDAEDCVQEAAMRAWRHVRSFREGAELRPWFLKIVANQCRDQLGGRWRSVLRLDELFPAPSRGTPEDAGDLRRALHRLPYDQRLAVVLRFYLDLSFEEVGLALGVSAKAARSRTYRALERLRLQPELSHE
ncbi:MAG: sigma-70 family RNA polymerase sigma factor [Candidatus Dormibacteraceae bacterium]